MAYDLVVIGASAGGFSALKRVLAALPPGFPLPVVLVLHRWAEGKGGSPLSALLQRVCALPVSDAQDKEALEPNHVYLAPASYHLLINGHGLALSLESPVHYARPSIDVLFESAAVAYRKRVIGVILTGASSDGAQGLAAIKQLGGLTIVQDPNMAEVRVMPDAAIATRAVDRILPLEDIGPFLVKTIESAQAASDLREGTSLP